MAEPESNKWEGTLYSTLKQKYAQSGVQKIGKQLQAMANLRF